MLQTFYFVRKQKFIPGLKDPSVGLKRNIKLSIKAGKKKKYISFRFIREKQWQLYKPRPLPVFFICMLECDWL